MSVEVDLILDRKEGAGRDALIPILQEVQEAEGYLSKESVTQIAEKLHLPSSKIFGVATFYNQFRFKPLGKYHIQICRGTACHVKGSASIMDRLERELGVGADETTGDGVFSLEVVACIGACGLAPVISVNGEFYANLESEDVPKILAEYRNKEEAK
jgi:NADH-quinone oxidoreductase E subunit